MCALPNSRGRKTRKEGSMVGSEGRGANDLDDEDFTEGHGGGGKRKGRREPTPFDEGMDLWEEMIVHRKNDNKE